MKKTVSFKNVGKSAPPSDSCAAAGAAPEIMPVKSENIKVRDVVWLRDKAKVFVKGTVVAGVGDDGKLGIQLQDGGALVRLHADELHMANQPSDSPDDTSALIHMNEPCVLDAVKVRYNRGDIYTYTGSILVALNPFRALDIYGEDVVSEHTKLSAAKVAPPHVYSVAEKAYTHMQRNGTNQAIIMSGESGAGKTETTKHTVRFLAKRAARTANLETLAEAIVESNTVTEAFGNAKTVRNSNSSRFGKFLQVFFGSSGAVAGGGMETYLLERPRVTQLAKGERSYHIFYQLLAGSSDVVKKDLCLACCLDGMDANNHRVLSSSGCLTIEGVSDSAKFEELQAGMIKVGLSAEECEAVFSVVAGVLHLTNVSFVDGDDGAVVDASCAAAVAAANSLLGVKGLASSLTEKTVTTGGARRSVVTKQLNAFEAARSRDSTARVIYTRIFTWLEQQVNDFLHGQDASSLRHIGLLDIFGFERFDKNGFEQLCINHTNEKLQQFFLKCVFKSERELYEQEGVRFPDISYQDNQGCIDAIEKYPHGVMKLLDNQCKQPVPTEKAFFEAVNRMHAGSEFFRPVIRYKKRESEAFVINHFAGACCYEREEIDGSWIVKNNDLLADELSRALAKSSVSLVAELFHDSSTGGSSNKAKRESKSMRKSAQRISIVSGQRTGSFGKRKPGSMFASIARRLCLDINNLLSELGETEAHFVRCIKPNAKSIPNDFETAKVLEQLRSSGVFDAVELMKAAYPTKIRYEDIYGRYASLLPADLVKNLPPAGFCEVVALACDVDRTDYALGFSQLFLRAGKGAFLEELVSMDVAEVVPLLEQKIREWERRKRAAILLGRFVLAWHQHNNFKRKRKAAPVLQRTYRGFRARSKTRKLLKVARERRRAEERAKRAAADGPQRREGQKEAAKVAPASTGKRTQTDADVDSLRSENAVLKDQVKTLTRQNAELTAAAAGGGEDAKELLRKAQLEIADLKAELLSVQQELQKKQQAESELHEELEKHREGSLSVSVRSDSNRSSQSLSRSSSKVSVEKPAIVGQHLKVNIERDDESGTLGVDVDVWQGRVTVAIIDPNVPAYGQLVVGDEIEGVGGVDCRGNLETALKCIINSPTVVSLDICRRPAVALLRNEFQMKTSKGDWNFVMVTLLDNRQLVYELPADSSAQIQERAAGEGNFEGEVNLLHVAKLELVDAADEQPAILSILLGSGVLYQLTCESNAEDGMASGIATLRSWQDELARMLSRARTKTPSKVRNAIVWQQGYMDLCVGVDEWAMHYFVLDERIGLRIYKSKDAFKADDPMRTIPRNSIGKATRGTGLEYFEWGIHVHLMPTPEMIDMADMVIEARAPSQNEMSRWLATLNMQGAFWHVDTGAAAVAAERRKTVMVPLPPIKSRKYSTTGEVASRRFSAHLALSLSPSAQPTVSYLELASGWINVKKSHATFGGTKRRFCRLVATIDNVEAKPPPPPASPSDGFQGAPAKAASAGRSNDYKRVIFYMLHKEHDALDKERNGHGALDMCEVTSVTASNGNRLVMNAGPRKVVLIADSATDCSAWLQTLDEHRGLLPYLSARESALQAAALPEPAPFGRETDGRETDGDWESERYSKGDVDLADGTVEKFVTVDGELLATWMEVAQGDCESVEFNLGFVALLKDLSLAFYSNAASANGPPTAQLTDLRWCKDESYTLDYNYEHAFKMSGADGQHWWLCPDSPERKTCHMFSQELIIVRQRNISFHYVWQRWTTFTEWSEKPLSACLHAR